MLTGKCIIFSAPSGSGKTTILKEIMSKRSDMEFSISATNRNPRGTELDGVDYHFLSTEEFKNRIEANAFVEFEEVYANRFYGTLESELQRIWAQNKIVLFDVDVVGGVRLKSIFKDNALALFIQAPNLDTLEQRLRGRNTDTEEEIKTRLEKAKEELSYAPKFDHVILNHRLDEAVAQTESIIQTFLSHG